MKKTSSKVALAAATVFTVTAVQACSQKVTPPPPPTVAVTTSQTPGGGIAEEVVTISATVQAIDQKTRTVTLLGPEGNTTTVRVSDEVRNLDQVKKGDVVTAAFYESVSYEVKKKGTAEPGVAEAADAARAPVGSRPAAVGGAAVAVTATITAIDRKTGVVKIKGPDGEVVSVKAQDPSRLEGVQVGDLVEMTFTEAVAISVDKPQQR